MFGPMDLSRSGAKVQMQPDTGVTFADVVGVDGAKLVSYRSSAKPQFPDFNSQITSRTCLPVTLVDDLFTAF